MAPGQSEKRQEAITAGDSALVEGEKKEAHPRSHVWSFSREVSLRVPVFFVSCFFPVVYFSRGTLPTKKG